MNKTRFAPSPTGFLHIGGLRSALYAYIFAVQNKGKFVLRIEDTDQSREVEGAVPALVKTLQKMGLNWDEGPIMANDTEMTEKGQNGPYFQSKRLKIYQEYAQKLIDSNNAYYCCCSAERLKEIRESQMAKKLPPKYDGNCRNNKTKPNEPHVIRLKVPEQGIVKFNDMIRGEVKIDHNEIDDQVLVKSDGFPTYHLANVVDDHLMEITHVIRGEEWLPSTPKHILMYQAFGWDIPEFAHLPLLLNPDKSKLSKRQGDVAVEDYLNKGYLPEALINYVALLGWHPQNDKELFTIKELIKEFDISRVQKAGAIFDVEKLNWFNAYYIRQMSENELINRIQDTGYKIQDTSKFKKIIAIEKERINNLSEIEDKIKFYFEVPNYDVKILIFKKSDKETTLKALELVLKNLTDIKKNDWKTGRIKDCLSSIVEKTNLTNGDVFWSTRVAVSGQEKSPPPEEVMNVLGKDESLKRLSKAVDLLT